jgi:hypothetical protein
MNNSSAQLDYSITLSDTITLTSGAGSSYYYNTGAGSGGFSADTITITGGGSGYTIGGAGVSSITLDDLSTSTFTWKAPEEFVDAFPDFDRIKKMCETYPGLKIAYEKFATTYKLVKDDYDTPEDQRPRP